MTTPARSPLADQADRERFASELERNFSVIAPAGVGKTTAIVARVAALAQADSHAADPVLPRLAVVTYTRKAAEEMQARARARLLADGASPELLGRFSQAFFGTIHSLCLLVLKGYGHLVGLPSNLEQTTRLEPLWRQYLRSTDTLLHHLPPHAREPFQRHGSLSAALELVLKLPADLPTLPALPPPPLPDISAILEAAPSKNKKAQQNIEAGQDFARNWLHALHNSTGHLPLPKQTTGGKDFVAAYAEAFRPLCDWLGEATLALAKGVAEDFRNYRKAQGKLSFDDMVSWAAAVLDHPEAGPQLRRQRWCVILDEAQDTDPMQFHVLLSLAGGSSNNSAANTPNPSADAEPALSPPATTPSLSPAATTTQSPARAAAANQHARTPAALPPAGRFCMVGDPQQAIYGDRADLVTYQGVHRALAESTQGEALRFTVTMRCDRAIVAVANRIFPNLLAKSEAPDAAQDADNSGTTAPERQPARAPRQVPYVPLEPRPDAGPGTVGRMPLQADDSLETTDAAPAADDEADDTPARPKKRDSDRQAARQLARTLAALSPEAFGAADWSEVGILCVRNDPLGLLARALEDEGVPVQNHSRLDNRGDSPAYAWFAGLARIIAEPENAFETAGVLREVFGISDGALHTYTLAAGNSQAGSNGKSPLPFHPLSLSAGALALSGPAQSAEVKAVGEALHLLRATRNRIFHLPLREAARDLCQMLDLRARLASLPDGRASAHSAELENLLLQAATQQEQGVDWLQWADALESDFEARIDSAEPQKGHIQLLSCHKSKGLQWPVVILASLFRPVSYASDNYPKLFFPSRDTLPAVAFASGHGHSAVERYLKLKAFQELQRLAYVACTRARRQMIWVDDSAFYEKPEGSFADALGIATADGSNADVWQTLPQWHPLPAGANRAEAQDDASAQPDTNAEAQPDTNAEPQLDTSTEATAFVATGSALSISEAVQPRPDWNLSFATFETFETETCAATPCTDGSTTPVRITPAAVTDGKENATARHRPADAAQLFIKRVLPSSLAIHAPRQAAGKAASKAAGQLEETVHPLQRVSIAPTAPLDTRPGHARNEPDGSRALPAFAELEEAAAATAGADYGNWWHKAMELAPWGKTEKAWQRHSQAMLTSCPNPQRGQTEWQALQASELYARLNRPEMIVRCELPLLWKDAQTDVAYDGFIDLVARDSATGQWLLIDWKTDRLHAFSDPADELLRCYGPQLDAYRKALTAMFSTPVQAHLYNTPTAQCAPPLQ